MGNVKVFSLILLQLSLSFAVCVAQGCTKISDLSGRIYEGYFTSSRKCWSITVPEDMYVRLEIKENFFRVKNCSLSYIQIDVAETGEEYKLCYEDNYPQSVIAVHDVNVTIVNQGGNYLTFSLYYNIDQAVFAVKGVDSSKRNAITWLKRQQSPSFGWDKYTHRAITALYLAGNASFRGGNLEEELFAKQLELQALVAVLRNSSDHMSVSDLSLFINALTVSCYNPRQFHGYDLLQILSKQVAASKMPIPGAYLTLCNANWTLPDSSIPHLMNVLYKQSEYPIHLDIQAMTVMALSCIISKTKGLDNIQKAIYKTTIQQFIADQRSDGSFGNVYTTALVTQALLATRKENDKVWKLSSTIKFLMQKLNSSPDFLSTYLVLPIFNSKSIVDIAKVNCRNYRKHGEDDEISDVTNKLRGKMRIQYSVYIGNQKDAIRTMHMSVPADSSAFDVMKIAEVINPAYKFLYSDVSGHMYVYDIAGVTNDPEAGKFWFLFTGKSGVNETLKRQTESPDKFIVEDGVHVIMWYKAVHI